MAVLMIGEVPNLTEEFYAGLLVEMWESEADSQNFFDNNVEPNPPPDIKPVRTFHPLHAAFTA